MTVTVTDVVKRLLVSDVLMHETTVEERLLLARLRSRRLVVLYTGPGPAWYRLTRRGRAELSDVAPARPEPMF